MPVSVKDSLYLPVYLKFKEKRKWFPFTIREVSVSLSVYCSLRCKPKKRQWGTSQTLPWSDWSLPLDSVGEGSSL